MNPGQPVSRVVPDDVVDGTFQNSLDCPAGTVVHAVPKLEVAQREFGVFDVEIKGIEFGFVEFVVLPNFSIQPLESLEEQTLVRIIERFAEVEILQLFTVTWARAKTGEQQEPEH